LIRTSWAAHVEERQVARHALEMILGSEQERLAGRGVMVRADPLEHPRTVLQGVGEERHAGFRLGGESTVEVDQMFVHAITADPRGLLGTR
jgi:hypothetical protein